MDPCSRHVLLTVDQMGRADRAAIAGGVPGPVLMEHAGAAVAEAIQARWSPRPTVVLCGPGNNGGDGFVVARRLSAAGWPVRLALPGPLAALRGDAAWAAGQWPGAVLALSPEVLAGAELVVDALFGAGLSRPLEGPARAVVEALPVGPIETSARDPRPVVVAIDVPSGIDGDSGQSRGAAPWADLTVSFFRAKPGHWLLPGRQRCGELVIADIGIPPAVLEPITPTTWANHPELWRPALPWPSPESHKYHRGHALVLGGPRLTGAARLAAQAARRVGVGLLTLACPAQVWPIYAATLPGALVEPGAEAADISRLLADRRRTAALLGPGAGLGATTAEAVLAALASPAAVVLDADALTSFAADPAPLFQALRQRPPESTVLTPHQGEFTRLFGPLPESGKLAGVRAAARHCGAVVLLKGYDTVIAAADGRAVINRNAPPTLATGGSGDVLAGLVLGLLAQGMPGLPATAAAAWLHGAAAERFGPGLIAEDLPEQLPAVLRQLAQTGE